MNRGVYSGAQIVRSAWRTSWRICHSLALFIVLLLPGFVPASAGPRRIQLEAAPPDVHITQVKARPAPITQTNTEVEIMWIAQVPRLTTLEEFDAVLDVRYSDGTRGVVRNQQLKSTSRATIVALPTHPRASSSAVLKDFRATVVVRFRIASSVAVVHQVMASQGDGTRGYSASSNRSQPDVVVTSAKLVTQGCSAGSQCVDVKWTAEAPRHISIHEFTATVESLHNDGTETRDSRIIGGQNRRVLLNAGRAGVEINSIKISLLTSFSLLDSKSAVREGSFSADGGFL